MGFVGATWLEYTRLAIFGTVTLFSIVELGVAGNLTYLTNTYYNNYYGFAALAIATAVLSLITFPLMIVFDLLTTDVFTSWVITELVWTGFLWVLWLASGAAAADKDNSVFGSIDCSYFNGKINTACHEFQAIEAFAFINWILLMGYFVALLVMAILGARKGGRIWTASVKAAEFGGIGLSTEKPTTTTVQPATTQYPPTGPSQTA
ncbi:hypothetical protein FISHEDRAFT_76212 [Fistulina hepatica ATCC 64428]|uniref:MARVEL domain-containing protein n=1 Tax=Fistulina hepatica ATCC 64428 TaxID=1128425 RepID=A0A0D7A6H4_9AGAR|nr:hypothetical protein FISHEDRAFT_76212 [Fistulina hepatica ATCC 64428]